MLRSEENIEELPVEGKIFRNNYFSFSEYSDEIIFNNCVFINCKTSFKSETDFSIKNSWICGLGCDDARSISFENCYFFDNDGGGGQEPVLSTRRTPTYIENSYIYCDFDSQVFMFRESEEVCIVSTEAMGDNSGSLLSLTLGTSLTVKDCSLSGFSFVFLLLDNSEAKIIRTSGDDVGRWIVSKDNSTVEIEGSPKITRESMSKLI